MKYSNQTESLNSVKFVFSYLTASSELLVSKEVVLFTEYCNNPITTKEKSAVFLEMNETDSFSSNFRQHFLIATENVTKACLGTSEQLVDVRTQQGPELLLTEISIDTQQVMISRGIIGNHSFSIKVRVDGSLSEALQPFILLSNNKCKFQQFKVDNPSFEFKVQKSSSNINKADTFELMDESQLLQIFKRDHSQECLIVKWFATEVDKEGVLTPASDIFANLMYIDKSNHLGPLRLWTGRVKDHSFAFSIRVQLRSLDERYMFINHDSALFRVTVDCHLEKLTHFWSRLHDAETLPNVVAVSDSHLSLVFAIPD